MNLLLGRDLFMLLYELEPNERTAQNASPNYQKLHARRIPVWDSHRLACPGRGAMTGASPG